MSAEIAFSLPGLSQLFVAVGCVAALGLATACHNFCISFAADRLADPESKADHSPPDGKGRRDGREG